MLDVRKRRFGAAVRQGALALLVVLLARPAHAQIGSARYSSIVIDAASGRVLSAAAPDDLRHPASLTKMMTLYMLFEALRDRRVTLNQLVPVSLHAASVEPSKLGLVPGTRLTVEQGILGLVTKSANDAAAALGELLGGDEDRFAQMMTLRARALGMSNTTFRNASGLPDPDQFSTARDLALLGRHLVQDFPVEYRYFSVPSFVFRGRVVPNHDHMLITYPGADGLKTGYTIASGYNLVTSAVHGPVRLVGVVLGAANGAERDRHMALLLDSGFADENVPAAELVADGAPGTRGRAPRGLMARLPALIASAEAAPAPATADDAAPAPAPYVGALTSAQRRRLARTPGLSTATIQVLARGPAAGWAVQLGSFATAAAAQHAAAAARHGAAAGTPRIVSAGVRGRPMFRVQLTGLTQVQAQAACSASVRVHAACLLVRPGPLLASR